MSEISSRYEIAPLTLSGWKEQFLKNASVAFSPDKSAEKIKKKLKNAEKKEEELYKDNFSRVLADLSSEIAEEIKAIAGIKNFGKNKAPRASPIKREYTESEAICVLKGHQKVKTAIRASYVFFAVVSRYIYIRKSILLYPRVISVCYPSSMVF